MKRLIYRQGHSIYRSVLHATDNSFAQGFRQQHGRLQAIIDSFQNDPANPYVGGSRPQLK